jgi:hypothetical protein
MDVTKFQFTYSSEKLPTTIGLCDVGEFENLPPGTAAQLKY